MKTFILTLALSLPLSILTPRVWANEADEKFQKPAAAYTQAELVANPEQATELGDHRFDDQLTDYSHAALDKTFASQKQFRIDVGTIDAAKLSGPNNVD